MNISALFDAPDLVMLAIGLVIGCVVGLFAWLYAKEADR